MLGSLTGEINERTDIPYRSTKLPTIQICVQGALETAYLCQCIEALGISDRVNVNGIKCKTTGCVDGHETMLDKMQLCLQRCNATPIYLVHNYGAAGSSDIHNDSFYRTVPRAHIESSINVIMNAPSIEYWLLLHFNIEIKTANRFEIQSRLLTELNRRRKSVGRVTLSSMEDFATESDFWGLLDGLSGLKKAIGYIDFIEGDTQERVRFNNSISDLLNSKIDDNDPDYDTKFETLLNGFKQIMEARIPFTNMDVLMRKLLSIAGK